VPFLKMSRKSQRKAARSQLVEAMKSYVEFPWDYSYLPWQDWPVDLRREFVRHASMFGRTWIFGRTSTLMDVHKYEARRLYNENWDGCRDLWKANYRARKHPGTSSPPRYTQTKLIGGFSGGYMELPASEDLVEPPAKPPIVEPVDPRVAESERLYLQRRQAEHDEFNRQQEKCYRSWLRRRRSAHEKLWRATAPGAPDPGAVVRQP
jgi:hypothetical protein